MALPVFAQDRVTTLAGQALIAGSTNGVSTNALFSDPAAIVCDASGTIYVADSRNHAIRKVATNGLVTTFAGQSELPGSSDGTAAQARFHFPSGIALGPDGSLFISDTGNHTIRKITAAGTVTTLAGLAGQSGFTNAAGSFARFNSPLGLAVANDGTIYVADGGNHLIRAVTPGGAVSTLAGLAETWGSSDGTGSDARFNGPVSVALDGQGNLFVSDSCNHTIRRITSAGAVTTWAGSPGEDGCVNGDRLAARFAKPAELAFDAHGNLFIADSFNHVIRKISTDGVVSTAAGRAGDQGTADGINGEARLFNPYGLTFRPDGSLLLADAYNELIREVFVPFRLRIKTAENGSSRIITWDSVVGTKYQVQHRSTLAGSNWTNLASPITASDITTIHTDSLNDSTGQKIYRVLVVP